MIENTKTHVLANAKITITALLRNKNWLFIFFLLYFLSAIVLLKNYAEEYSVTSELYISRVYTPELPEFKGGETKILESSFFNRIINEVNNKSHRYCSGDSGILPGTLQIFDVTGKETLRIKYKSVSSDSQDKCMHELIGYISSENASHLKKFKSQLISRFSINKRNMQLVNLLRAKYKPSVTYDPQAALVFLQSEIYETELLVAHDELIKAIETQPSHFNVIQGPSVKIVPYTSFPFLLIALFLICVVIPLIALFRFNTSDSRFI